MAFVYSIYFTALMLTSRCMFYSFAKVKVVCYSILNKFFAVSNQNMYTPNLHTGILDDTTSVVDVGALRELCY